MLVDSGIRKKNKTVVALKCNFLGDLDKNLIEPWLGLLCSRQQPEWNCWMLVFCQ